MNSPRKKINEGKNIKGKERYVNQWIEETVVLINPIKVLQHLTKILLYGCYPWPLISATDFSSSLKVKRRGKSYFSLSTEGKC